MIEMLAFTQGPAQTNAYLLGDDQSRSAIVIDPAWDGAPLAEAARSRKWRIAGIWLTHAHFDHFGGAGSLADRLPAPPPIALHPADLPLWRALGGASLFGIDDFDPGPEPTVELMHGMSLHLGKHTFEVRHSPGHSPGHVLFYLQESRQMWCGDLIFLGGVGRTDLPGGDWAQLLDSIQKQVMSLPDDVRLYPGHGPYTTVGDERRGNPFLGTGF
jgi:hydroxyacylglutathione hydrolase